MSQKNQPSGGEKASDNPPALGELSFADALAVLPSVVRAFTLAAPSNSADNSPAPRELTLSDALAILPSITRAFGLAAPSIDLAQAFGPVPEPPSSTAPAIPHRLMNIQRLLRQDLPVPSPSRGPNDFVTHRQLLEVLGQQQRGFEKITQNIIGQLIRLLVQASALAQDDMDVLRAQTQE